jgi:hypothetical protein
MAITDSGVLPGLVVVDTPGVGGLEGGHTRAALAFIPDADAVVFVSDATAELSSVELGWLERIAEAGPIVRHVMTKIDLAPAWRRVAEANLAHLDQRGTPGEITPTSAALHQLGTDLGDATMIAESGIPALRHVLDTDVVDPARERAAHRARLTARRMTRVLAEQLRRETESFDSNAAELAAELEAARTRLEHVRGPASRSTGTSTNSTRHRIGPPTPPHSRTTWRTRCGRRSWASTRRSTRSATSCLRWSPSTRLITHGPSTGRRTPTSPNWWLLPTAGSEVRERP